ncbi:MAG: helix-turn-helix domain-containing protein [Candidatus Aenigmatarchaeota archaeon]
MDVTVLEDLGFSNAEIKIYLALLELGTSTAGPVLKKSGLQNSVVHMTLGKMVEKGLVSFIKKGKVKYYQPADPKNILRIIDEKKKNFEDILPALLTRQTKQEKQEAEIFEGFTGFKNMMFDFIKNHKKGDEYLFFSFYSKERAFDNVFNFFRDFEKLREKRNIMGKGIVPVEIKDKFKGRNMKNLIFVNFPIPNGITVCGDKIALLTHSEEKQISFLIHSHELAESFRIYFYSIWNKYKK